jgi:two-component system phosphate regulon sensor histidine kinase PhoR
MKRIFPLIIFLITVSLLGIIYIQVSWIRTVAKMREEQFEEKLYLVVQKVAEELVEEAVGDSEFSGQSSPFSFQGDVRDIYRRNSVSARFSVYEIKEKLHNAFLQNNLKDLQFEFSVNRDGQHLLSTAHFQEMSRDSMHHLMVYFPLVAGGGSLLENLTPEEVLFIVVPDIKSIVIKSMNGLIVASILFTLIIITAFYLTFGTMLKQKKISEMKTDFINNMTHELKTPLATISLAIDAIRTEKVQKEKDRFDYFTGIIKDENKRMNGHVETILQAAQLEKQEIHLEMSPVHLHEIIQQVCKNLELQIKEKNGQTIFDLQATNDLIEADVKHFSNLLNNLIENAIKYSKENSLYIRIATRSIGRKSIRIEIEDHGIGMSKETLSRIFEKFYRAHTGNLHNVKGFGLGLSYVKEITQAHQGRIKADSVLGKGSTFILTFPRAL